MEIMVALIAVAYKSVTALRAASADLYRPRCCQFVIDQLFHSALLNSVRDAYAMEESYLKYRSSATGTAWELAPLSFGV